MPCQRAVGPFAVAPGGFSDSAHIYASVTATCLVTNSLDGLYEFLFGVFELNPLLTMLVTTVLIVSLRH